MGTLEADEAMKDSLALLTPKMGDIEWNAENEIQLFYAMVGHKPTGVNKHFQMMFIHHKLSTSLSCELSSKTIWQKLETLYDLAALDESDKLPFPNTTVDFYLPDIDFKELLDERCKIEGFDDKDMKGRMKPIKKEEKETKDDHHIKDFKMEDDDDMPKRFGKRGRDSKPSSPASTPTTKRRRN